MPRVQFLGTGNAHSPPGRLHALVLIDGKILVDAPPTVLPQLRQAGVSPGEIEHLLFTHWHADHMFGFPFILLDRQYVSKPQNGPMNIYLRPNGKEILSNLSHVGFPGSLEEALEDDVEWIENELGSIGKSGWKYERFPVSHTPETDPHGYLLTHESGFTILHCGDSGPCEEINQRAENVDVILVEMGVPNFVESAHHHNPKEVSKLAQRFPKSTVLVTHNFSRGEGEMDGFEIPQLPESIIQLEDGDYLDISTDGSFYLINNRRKK